jgi:hypothetical protein
LSRDCAHAEADKVCYGCKMPGHVANECPSATAV